MDLHQLRCFLAVADELHFGRAARRLEMLPSALSRDIRLLETSLGTRLLLRTTRNVMLSQDGAAFVDDARALVTRADVLAAEVRERGRERARSLIRIGAIDTAAAGLVPALLRDFRELHPSVAVQLAEDKTIRLVPKLLSGRLDIAFIRPPEQLDKRIEWLMLFHETPVVAVPSRHRLAGRRRLSIEALAGEPMIVPDRSSRPHSHDLTIKLFEHSGLRPNLSQIAEEKQTIVHLVAAGLGLAIVPRRASGLGVAGVRFVPLASRETAGLALLPMAAAWLRNSRDPLRDELLALLRLPRYAAGA
ncbi:LysR family transcriptional regulator [Reyranella sp.]|uniref:LysR family transcriptional regulator n=1 Tax=Reyranella sp. TaxID=1929291 RepID=UPI000BCC9289|nr:LysR family transcriptional regulator [Reyranella sp.]OYY45861.1 MAG: LysR family transcriptional regulator [Rhodospirillales bacterium 35-66-84]OYZ96242.1 MAG: LysR family transcriptional regulator [Rhodospirillales bacterium 24-66-33]OZB28596.1 MAG: LysR family transcriptional regulator [Rhodospirillales bacterium 39-66-50]HQS14182.1 LysR family transcriptional regulator [Reyranella sp.]HQT11178.1 LysR family transcriptional regulator [Reyranella sp.]